MKALNVLVPIVAIVFGLDNVLSAVHVEPSNVHNLLRLPLDFLMIVTGLTYIVLKLVSERRNKHVR